MNKFQLSKSLVNKIYQLEIKTNISPASGFRSRCEFGYRDSHYTMIDNGKKIFINSLKISHPKINEVMPKLLELINKNLLIKTKLFQINFRANNKNNILVSLIYHKEVCNELLEDVKKIKKKLNIEFILRSRKKILATSSIFLEEYVDSNKPFYLYQTDQTFFQPNHLLLPKMINLVESYVKNPKDLLELYCGCGTFTIPLSRVFNKVFATENNRKSINCLDMSIEKNSADNINYSRLSCDEVSMAMSGTIYRRLKGIKLSDYNFSHLLLDPPRSGLTSDVISLANKFDNIIYISCNPETYVRDIENLSNFKILEIQFFDQFVNTKHLEIVSILQKI